MRLGVRDLTGLSGLGTKDQTLSFTIIDTTFPAVVVLIVFSLTFFVVSNDISDFQN